MSCHVEDFCSSKFVVLRSSMISMNISYHSRMLPKTISMVSSHHCNLALHPLQKQRLISSCNLPHGPTALTRHLPEQLDTILVDRQVELKYTGNVRESQNLRCVSDPTKKWLHMVLIFWYWEMLGINVVQKSSEFTNYVFFFLNVLSWISFQVHLVRC